jgi:hypothetical protein
MNSLLLSKIEKFSTLTPEMQISFQRSLAYWDPEFPPLTTLFSTMANSFIDEFNSIDERESQIVFDAIEEMLEGEDQDLDIGASTGFLETIATKHNFSKKAKEMLGEKSRLFLQEWNQFTGVADYGL